MIDGLRDGKVGSLDDLCEAFAVSRSGYYDHLQKPRRIRQQEDQLLSIEIASAFKASRETYGSPRLTVDVRRKGHRISRHRTARLMRQIGIHPRQKRAFIPKTTTSNPASHHAPNRLMGSAPTSALDQTWV
jgi:putative transposase